MMQPAENFQPSAPSIPVPLLDMGRQYAPLRDEIHAALLRVCQSGRFILGPDCEQLEKSIAGYCQARHAVACASGSDALLLALMAAKVGAGDEVILPSYTFFATASAVTRVGARPVFVDIDPVTYNIDPALVVKRLSVKTKAIIPVHLYGQCAEMAPLMTIARRHALCVIEDACQAIGARYSGRPAGSLGDMACFSFYPTKNLGGAGDGGLLTTHDDGLAVDLKLLRGHGMEPRYYHKVIGINSRLDSLQAAILNVKFPHLDRWGVMRQTNAARYAEMFAARGLDRVLGLPHAAPHQHHVWNQYIVRVPDAKRDALREHLAKAKVGTEIYYPVPLHQQECFRYLGYANGSLPNSEKAARETLALPIFPELTDVEQQTVVDRIADFFGVTRPTSAIRRPKFLQLPSTQRQDAEHRAAG